jgi:hypothetical protein
MDTNNLFIVCVTSVILSIIGWGIYHYSFVKGNQEVEFAKAGLEQKIVHIPYSSTQIIWAGKSSTNFFYQSR